MSQNFWDDCGDVLAEGVKYVNRHYPNASFMDALHNSSCFRKEAEINRLLCITRCANNTAIKAIGRDSQPKGLERALLGNSCL